MQYEIIECRMNDVKRIHFIGIGGVSMSSLAAVSQRFGYEVQGSDRSKSDATEELESRGIRVFYGHSAGNTAGADAVVYTAAIPADNPELVKAREDGLLLLTRGEFLGWLMKRYEIRIGVAGTHGKSTTTSMLAGIWMCAGANPTVISGAKLSEMNGSWRLGGGRDFLFEACEYKDSFLSFFPTTAVVTNVEWDHTDYFRTFGAMKESFLKYMNIASLAVVCADNAEARALSEKTSARVVLYGIEAQDADYTAKDVTMDAHSAHFTLCRRGEELAALSLKLTGTHAVLDALAAAAASLENGIGIEAIREGLARFSGAERRFQYRGRIGGAGAEVYDDYAHHPTEIRATLDAARKSGKRIFVVFQPHTYSRTSELFEDFCGAFGQADRVFFADIFAARESNTCGISSRMLAERVKNASYLPSFEKIAAAVRAETNGDDLVIVMGAGDIIRVTDLLL